MEKFFLRALGRSYTYCCAEATPPLPAPQQQQPPPPSGRTSGGGRRSTDVAVLRSKASARHARSSPRKRRARRERTTCSSGVDGDDVVVEQRQYGPESLRADCVKDDAPGCCCQLLDARVVTRRGGETVTSFTPLAPSARRRLILRSYPGPYGSWKSPPVVPSEATYRSDPLRMCPAVA
ncbi:hypothetical protein HPB52_006043 [Rhipicephalus sanguineus]|uniref:Uncharacterized protein n=1 Tax=Rhipicephalus sanguineus TaxID=34632 RepID=A0A9D4SVQ7_RHISA|nr:hypothetical protein HPB52_006043 [Rhipicephalus sanguineus]